MSPIFLFLALFHSTVAQFNVVDPLAPYKGTAGTCPLRPLNCEKAQYMMCIPNKAKALEFGDEIRIAGIDYSGSSATWSINLLSSSYQPLYHISIRPGSNLILFNNNAAPWGNGPWTPRTETYVLFPSKIEGKLWHRIKNGPEGITFEIDMWKKNTNSPLPYVFRHRIPNPRTEYKYLAITKPASLKIDAVLYHSALASNLSDEKILFAENQWNFRTANI